MLARAALDEDEIPRFEIGYTGRIEGHHPARSAFLICSHGERRAEGCRQGVFDPAATSMRANMAGSPNVKQQLLCMFTSGEAEATFAARAGTL